MPTILETHLQETDRSRVSQERVLQFYRDKEGKKFYRNYFLLVVIGENLKDKLHDFAMWQAELKTGKELLLTAWSAERRRGLEHLAQDLAAAHLSYYIVGPEGPHP